MDLGLAGRGQGSQRRCGSWNLSCGALPGPEASNECTQTPARPRAI